MITFLIFIYIIVTIGGVGHRYVEFVKMKAVINDDIRVKSFDISNAFVESAKLPIYLGLILFKRFE